MADSEDSAEWRCTDCGETYETNTRSCSVCDGQAFARFDDRTIVYERYEDDEEQEPRTIRHLNKDAIAYLLTDTANIRVEVIAAVILIALVLNSFATETFGETAGTVAWAAVVGGYVVAAGLRRPSEGVTIQSLGERVSFGGDPEPYLESFRQRTDVLLRYASGWKAPLYTVDREYWFVPARLDGLRHRSETDDLSRYIAIGSGLLTGLLVGSLANTAYGIPISIGIGGGAAVVGGIVLWLYIRDPTDIDTLVFRTDGGTRALFKLPIETAEAAVDQYQSAMDELDEQLLTIEHGDGLTEYVPRSKLLVTSRRTVEWTWISLAVGTIIALLVGVLTWFVTDVVGFDTIERIVASVLATGIFALAVWLYIREPDEGELSSLATSQSIPSAELDQVFEAFTDTFDDTITVSGRIRTPFRRVQYRTLFAPKQIDILEYYEGRWYPLQYAKFIAVTVTATVVAALLARTTLEGSLWLYLLAIGGLVTLGAIFLLYLEEGNVTIRLHLRDGSLRQYRLGPGDAASVRQAFRDSQPTVSVTDESPFWTQHRYVNLERVGAVTNSVPSLGWARKLLVVIPAAAAIGGSVYLFLRYDLGWVLPTGAVIVGVILSFFAWVALGRWGTQIVTGSGRLVASDIDAEEIRDRLKTIQDNIVEFDASTSDHDTWHIVPREIAALEKWRPPEWPWIGINIVSLVTAGGAGYRAFLAAGSSTIGYVFAGIVGLCVLYVVRLVLAGVLEFFGIPVFDRTRADLVGAEWMETTAQTGAHEFEAFDSLSNQSEGDPTIYRVGQRKSAERTIASQIVDLFGSITGFESERDEPASMKGGPETTSVEQLRTEQTGAGGAESGTELKQNETASVNDESEMASAERTRTEQGGRREDDAETEAELKPSPGSTDTETEQRESAPSDVWYKLTLGGILVWIATFVFPPLIIVSWPLLPFAMFFDSRRMYRLTGTPRFWWGYVVGALIPVLGILVAVIYLLRRPNTISGTES